VEWCIKQGYINETRSLLDGRFSHAITDKGLEFLNKGENNEQQDNNSNEHKLG
jgi:hypothetical protein